MPTAVAAGIAAVTGLAATSTAVVIASNVVVAAGSVGLSLLAQSALKPKSQAPGQAAPSQRINGPETRTTFRSAAAPWQVPYGTVRIGGVPFFLETVPPYLYLGLIHSSRRISGIRQAYIGEVPVDFGPDRAAITDPFWTGTTARVEMSFRDGDPAQAIDPILAADFTALDAQFRQRGLATSVWKFHFGADQNEFISLYGNVQIPNVSLLVDGALVYDPRAAGQDVDDETTWTFSSNASLIQADFLRQPYGGRIASDRIDWDAVAAAADYDDGLVALAGGGWQKRYTIDGLVSLDQNPYEILSRMTSSNRALIRQNRGLVSIVPARPREPTFAIHDGVLAGGLTYRDARGRSEAINRVRARFVAPDREYQLVPGPVLDRADLQAADGELLDHALDLPFTATHQRAQRLSQAALEESRLGRQLQVAVTVDRLTVRIEAGDVGRVQSATFPSIDGTYECVEVGYAADFATAQLSLQEYSAAVETDWNAAQDEQAYELAELDVTT